MPNNNLKTTESLRQDLYRVMIGREPEVYTRQYLFNLLRLVFGKKDERDALTEEYIRDTLNNTDIPKLQKQYFDYLQSFKSFRDDLYSPHRVNEQIKAILNGDQLNVEVNPRGYAMIENKLMNYFGIRELQELTGETPWNTDYMPKVTVIRYTKQKLIKQLLDGVGVKCKN